MGRSGRFGRAALAVTLFDREVDEKNFWDIVDYFGMKNLVIKLEEVTNQIGEILDEINNVDIQMRCVN